MSKNKIEIHDEDDAAQRQPRLSPDGAGDEPVTDDEATTQPVSVEEALRAERDSLQEKLLHSMADYQNLARRARLDVEAARAHKTRDIARSLLTVLDHFDHALQVDPAKTTTADLLDGVTIVRDELNKALAQFEVQRMKVNVGDEFDPNRHEALMRQPVEGMEPNHIAQQLQPGYLHGEHTLRPAKVAVSE